MTFVGQRVAGSTADALRSICNVSYRLRFRKWLFLVFFFSFIWEKMPFYRLIFPVYLPPPTDSTCPSQPTHRFSLATLSSPSTPIHLLLSFLSPFSVLHHSRTPRMESTHGGRCKQQLVASTPSTHGGACKLTGQHSGWEHGVGWPCG